MDLKSIKQVVAIWQLKWYKIIQKHILVVLNISLFLWILICQIRMDMKLLLKLLNFSNKRVLNLHRFQLVVHLCSSLRSKRQRKVNDVLYYEAC